MKLIDSAVVLLMSQPSGRLLLLRRSNAGQDTSLHGRWGFPGGKQDEGEELWETARRELLEETGIEVYRPGKGPIYEFPPYRVGVFTVYLSNEPADRLVIDLSPSEHTESGWFLPAEALKLDLAGPGTRFVLEQLAGR